MSPSPDPRSLGNGSNRYSVTFDGASNRDCKKPENKPQEVNPALEDAAKVLMEICSITSSSLTPSLDLTTNNAPAQLSKVSKNKKHKLTDNEAEVSLTMKRIKSGRPVKRPSAYLTSPASPTQRKKAKDGKPHPSLSKAPPNASVFNTPSEWTASVGVDPESHCDAEVMEAALILCDMKRTARSSCT